MANAVGYVEKPVELHAPELYDAAVDAVKVEGFAAVDEAAVAVYRDQGFLALEHAFSDAEVKSALDGLYDLVMGKVPNFTGISFEAGAAGRLESMTWEQRFDAVRKLMPFCNVEPRLNAMAHHPALLAVIERLLGGKPKMIQDMALLKPPRGREKPWHQDHAYFDYAMGTPIVGVWIALDPATRANGCMHMLARGHQAGPRLHFARRDWQICDTEMLGVKSVAVPLAPGGMLFFDGLIPHGTPYNDSTERRRAVQFHYVREDAVKVSQEERMKVFGSEGKDVTC